MEREPLRGMDEGPRDDSIPCVFERGTPVYAYWVDRCEEFEVVDVRGRALGRVRRAGRVGDELVVARRFKSRRIAKGAVQAVWPRERVIAVSTLVRESGRGAADPVAVGDETLPWFDLVGATEPADASEPSTQRLLRRRLASLGDGVAIHARSAIRSAVAAMRRRSRLLRVGASRQIEKVRRSLARSLISIARVVEPRSEDR